MMVDTVLGLGRLNFTTLRIHIISMVSSQRLLNVGMAKPKDLFSYIGNVLN